MTKVYRSKVDGVLLLFILAMAFGPALPMMIENFLIAPFLILLIVLGFILWVLFSIEYKIEGDFLYVKVASLVVEEIKIADITSIVATRTLLSAPAASFDRICIKCERREVVVSPRNKKAFIQDLCKVSPREIDVQIKM